jgi:hypothetical protein
MGNIDISWKKGIAGDGAEYSFSPLPSIERPVTGQKLVEFKIPLAMGSLVQLLGKDSNTIVLRGVLVEPDPGRYDFLDTKRIALIAGIGTEVGQLHIESNLGTDESQHLFYIGVPRSIVFADQTNSQIIDYSIEILISNATENVA